VVHHISYVAYSSFLSPTLDSFSLMNYRNEILVTWAEKKDLGENKAVWIILAVRSEENDLIQNSFP